MVFPNQHRHHCHRICLISNHLLHLLIVSYKIQLIHLQFFLWNITNRNEIQNIFRIICKFLQSICIPPYRILVKAFSFASGSMLWVPGNVPFFNIVMAFLRAISSKRFLSIRSPVLSCRWRDDDDDLERLFTDKKK